MSDNFQQYASHQANFKNITIGTKLRIYRAFFDLDMWEVQQGCGISTGDQSKIENERYSEIKDCEYRIEILIEYYKELMDTKKGIIPSAPIENLNHKVPDDSLSTMSVEDLKQTISSLLTEHSKITNNLIKIKLIDHVSAMDSAISKSLHDHGKMLTGALSVMLKDGYKETKANIRRVLVTAHNSLKEITK